MHHIRLLLQKKRAGQQIRPKMPNLLCVRQSASCLLVTNSISLKPQNLSHPNWAGQNACLNESPPHTAPPSGALFLSASHSVYLITSTEHKLFPPSSDREIITPLITRIWYPTDGHIYTYIIRPLITRIWYPTDGRRAHIYIYIIVYTNIHLIITVIYCVYFIFEIDYITILNFILLSNWQ
jgi:hypothetical protein